MTLMWCHNACSSILGTREKLLVWLEIALPVTERKGKGKGKMSLGPWTKYGHANLILFCPYTNERCSVFLYSSPFPSLSVTGHSLIRQVASPLSQKWTACIVTSSRCRFAGVLSNKKAESYYSQFQTSPNSYLEIGRNQSCFFDARLPALSS